MFATHATSLVLASAAEGNGNWLPHDSKEVLWGTLAFLIVVGMLWSKAGPAIKKALAARPARIEQALSEASDSRLAAEAQFADIKTALADSDKEASRIIEEARETAKRLHSELITRAEADAVAIKERATAELASARRQAQADLSSEVSRLALGAAEQVVHSNLDDTTQQSLIEQYIGQVGASN